MSYQEDGCAHCGRSTGSESFPCSECRGARVCRSCAKETGLLGLSAAWEERQFRMKAAQVNAKRRAEGWQSLHSAIKKGSNAGDVLKLLVGGKR